MQQAGIASLVRQLGMIPRGAECSNTGRGAGSAIWALREDTALAGTQGLSAVSAASPADGLCH